jgi:hypothetical protein
MTELASLRTTLQDVIPAFAKIEDRLLPPRPVESPPRIKSPSNPEDSHSKHPRQGDTPTRIAVSKSTPSPVHQSPGASNEDPMQLESQFQITECTLQPTYATQPAADSPDSPSWNILSFSNDPIQAPLPPSVQKTVHDGESFHDTVTSEMQVLNPLAPLFLPRNSTPPLIPPPHHQASHIPPASSQPHLSHRHNFLVGDVLHDKPDNALRIYVQNVNGIKLDKDKVLFKNMLRHMRNINAD